VEPASEGPLKYLRKGGWIVVNEISSMLISWITDKYINSPQSVNRVLDYTLARRPLKNIAFDECRSPAQCFDFSQSSLGLWRALLIVDGDVCPGSG
jgi:hypothetical protein